MRLDWPKALLHLDLSYRRPEPLDAELLGSPQLFALKIKLFRDYNSATRHFHSEFQALTRILVNSNGLKTLSVTQGVNPGWYSGDQKCIGPLNLNLVPGDELPPLLELQFSETDYHATEAHMQQWARSMDWSKLRRLDVGRYPPRYVFQTLTGLLPQLKSLAVGFYDVPLSHVWSCEPDTVKAFLESIDALEELSWMNYSTDCWSAAWPSIVKKHGPSLRKLKLRWENPLRVVGLQPEEVEQLAINAADLEELTIDLGLIRDPTVDHYSVIVVRNIRASTDQRGPANILTAGNFVGNTLSIHKSPQAPTGYHFEEGRHSRRILWLQLLPQLGQSPGTKHFSFSKLLRAMPERLSPVARGSLLAEHFR